MMTETVVTVDQSQAAPPNAAHQAQAKPDNSLNWIKFNIKYFQSIPGILKLVQLVFGIICMACASPALLGASHWFLFVAVTSFIATVLWSFVYLLGIREVLNMPINWILTELINTGIATLLYFIAFIVQLAFIINVEVSVTLNSKRSITALATSLQPNETMDEILVTIVFFCGGPYFLLRPNNKGHRRKVCIDRSGALDQDSPVCHFKPTVRMLLGPLTKYDRGLIHSYKI